MYLNLFKIILRNIWKYRTYSIINLVGMGIGIAALIWAFVLHQFAFSFDDFHKEKHTVYRTLVTKKNAEGLRGLAPMPLVAHVKNDFAGVTNAARWDSRGLSVTAGSGTVFTENVHFTDPGFFTMFQFPLVSGNHNFKDNNTVLITEKTAKKYFGNQNAVGKTLTFYAGETYALPLTVTGVLKNVPSNSTIHFELIANFDNYLNTDGSKMAADNWGWFMNAAFFQIPDAANASRIQAAMNKYNPLQNNARNDWQVAAYKLVSIADIATWSNVLETNSLYERPNNSAAYGTIVLAILIFLSACLNFSNTTVARANRRLKEIGIRKVLGSTYAQLMRQLLFESAAIMLAAIVLAMLINTWWLPIFNAMFGNIQLQANYLTNAPLQLFLLLVLAIATVMAGAYPAFYVSRFNATAIFRGNVRFGGSNIFSRLMLGLQLCIAIITVIAGIAFANNASFQQHFNYGYNVQNTIGMGFSDSASYTILKNEMSKLPGVKALSGTRNHIYFDFRVPAAEAEGIKKEIRFLEVGDTYTQTMQIGLSKGRFFNGSREADYKDALLITQKMVAEYGWTEEQALGKKLTIDSAAYTVCGVVKDFHMGSFFQPLVPVALKLGRPNRYRFLILHADAKDISNVYAKASDTWHRLFPLKPFDGFYQNEVAMKSYKITTNIAIIFQWFAAVSILLTATGLFALVSLTTLKKMKEIALRRVAGASPQHILLLINKSYVWIFVIAAMLGCAGGWALSELLLNLIFEINAGVTAAAPIYAVIALFTITFAITGFKVAQAVRSNPVKLLRTE
jgi:putative ABC transport system permease protein